MTESIFPQAEAWLLDGGDRQEALELIAKRKEMSKYASVMDFLFCEIFTHYKSACFQFYRDEGPQLKDLITCRQLIRFNNALLKALELAYAMFREKRIASWTDFREQVLLLAA